MSIELKHIQYVYGQGTAYEKKALKDVSFEIPQGQFLGIIGHTGSGKVYADPASEWSDQSCIRRIVLRREKCLRRRV